MDDIFSALDKLGESRDQAIKWLLDSIDASGRPKGCELGNGWSRVPWTLALAGKTSTAAAVLEWAAHEGLGVNGDFRCGPARGTGHFNAYKLGHLAMGALHLERYDIANQLLDRLEDLQARNGGLRFEPLRSEFADFTEMTSTAQAGIAALLGGREAMAAGCRKWLQECLDSQPEFPDRLFVGRVGENLITQPPERLAWLLAVDFRKPRQAYYHSGAAAAFLGAYAMRFSDLEAMAAGHRFLLPNIQGASEQLTDKASVQACKFGWGVAVMQIADPTSDYLPHLLRMSQWFVECQADDGSWAPSSFLTPSPTVVDKMMKTAEHAMEVTALMAALEVVKVRRASLGRS